MIDCFFLSFSFFLSSFSSLLSLVNVRDIAYGK